MHMRRKASRRRHRSRNRYQSRNRKNVSFTPVIVMLCVSIACGYAAAKYVVEPVVNYVPQLTAEKGEEVDLLSGDNADKTIVDEAEVEDTEDVKGYALQFGCYSGKTSAELAMPSIGADNLEIIEQDDLYKIIGEVYKTKKEAKKALEDLPETANAFVTPIYE